MGVVFDAEAVADFKDTLELLSIECKDANGATVPGVSLIITDNQGQPMYTFPNSPPTATTTTTTIAEATTTTTTTLEGATTTTTVAEATTTTTLRGGTVTTTTLPAACADGATFASVTCRLAELLQAVQTAADGTVGSKLAGKVSAAQQAVTAAEHALTTSHKQSSKRISKALNALAAYLRGLKTHNAKRALQKDIRAALAAPVVALRADLKTLRGK